LGNLNLLHINRVIRSYIMPHGPLQTRLLQVAGNNPPLNCFPRTSTRCNRNRRGVSHRALSERFSVYTHKLLGKSVLPCCRRASSRSSPDGPGEVSSLVTRSWRDRLTTPPAVRGRVRHSDNVAYLEIELRICSAYQCLISE